MSVEFIQKWIESAVCGLLGNDAVDESDLAKIKYLAVGESFQNDFFIEMSLEQPPKPFVNFDGGDEWTYCLRGADIKPLIEKFKGKTDVELSMFGLDKEDEEWEEIIFTEESESLWKKFSKCVSKDRYYEKHTDLDEWDAWYDGVSASLWRDISLFTGVEVLRIQGLDIPDLTFLDNFPDLRALELVETKFAKTDGIEKLERLEQLACWLD